MITPHRYLNLDTSLINVSYLILKELTRSRLLTYNELYEVVSAKLQEDINEVYPYALNFLFLLGKLNYHKGTLDAFELNENQQALLQ